MKYFLIFLIAVVVIGGGMLVYQSQTSDIVVAPDPATEPEMTDENNTSNEPAPEPAPEEDTTEDTNERPDKTVLGTSVEGTEIVAHHFGNGDTELLLVGGVHGGYSPNTAALAEEFVTYLAANPDAVPNNMTVTVIPALNPDGLDETGAAGRFNANDVDLNRNFACEWSSEATWRDQTISGGESEFSEPEAQALRDYVVAEDPDRAIVWFSQEGKVYPSACGTGPSSASVALADTFATAANYPTEDEFDAYAITGDMVNWMAAQNIPAISVLLSDHANTEWEKNRAGVEAVLNRYATQ
jgi:hypothetical protein